MPWMLVAGVGVAACAAAVLHFGGSSQTAPRPPPPAPEVPGPWERGDASVPMGFAPMPTVLPVAAGGMPRLLVNESDLSFAELLQQVVAAREPVILQNAPVDEWAAFQRWKAAELAEAVTEPLESAKQSHNRLFVAAAEKYNQLLNAEPTRRDVHETVDVSMREFVDSMGGEQFLYWAGPLDAWGAQFLDDVAPLDAWTLDDTMSVNAWISHAGVTANTHLDRSHNFHVMVEGHKFIRLWEPIEHDALYLFPSSHPSYHQSQVDMAAPDFARFPRLAQAPCRETVLYPGEVMYIPPYHFHHITALDFAVSLSILHVSEEEKAISRLYPEIPIDRNWPLQVKVRGARLLLDLLFEGLGWDHTAEAFSRRVVWDSRFWELREHFGEHLGQAGSEIRRTNCFRKGAMDPMWAKVQAYIEHKMPALLDQVRGGWESLPRGVAEIAMGNYIEEMAIFAAGPDSMVAFVDKCL